MGSQFTRRHAVKSIGTLVVGVSLAGCSGNGDGGDGNGNGGGGNGDGGTTVDMTDELVFDPDQLTISVGETVVWETVGTVGHSVTAYEDEIPDGADYFASGGFDTEQAARDAYAPGDTDAGDVPEGESYEHTFETAGTYEYFCIPHVASGMVGTIQVEES
jgi:plastocyanin